MNRQSFGFGALKAGMPLLVAAIVFAGAVLLPIRSGGATTTGSRSASSQVFASIEAAQEVVPFHIETLPSVPSELNLVAVGVTTHEDDTTVDILYRSAADRTLQLTQSTTKMRLHGPDAVLSTANVNGKQARVITGSNTSGTQIGIVRWRVGSMTHMLVSTHTSGPDLVPLASTLEVE